MPTLVVSITLFVLALLIGIEVIGKVPATLHTPLMSGANSIHGIVIVGVVIVAAEANSPLAYVFIFLAAVGLVQTLERITLPRRVFAPLLVLSPALLEIYLLHPYLLVRSDAVPVRWGYAASMVLTVTVALVLSRMSLALTARRG